MIWYAQGGETVEQRTVNEAHSDRANAEIREHGWCVRTHDLTRVYKRDSFRYADNGLSDNSAKCVAYMHLIQQVVLKLQQFTVNMYV